MLEKDYVMDMDTGLLRNRVTLESESEKLKILEEEAKRAMEEDFEGMEMDNE